MCTVSVIQTPGGFRMLHSRDELRSRSIGHPPEWNQLASGVSLLCPTDADAGGTWVGCREDGFTLALVNYNIPENGRPTPSKSRGDVIPKLASAADETEAASRLAGLDLLGTSPFRLALLDPRGAGHLLAWDGLRLSEPSPVQPAFCLVSSGLGDHRVRPRLPLFEQIVEAEPTAEVQDGFHRHHWDDRPEISVLMSREDARTVSITTLQVVGGQRPMMTEHLLPEGEVWCDPVGAALAR